MLNDFTVGFYRGLQNLELKDLRKVNTLVSRYHDFSIEFFESLFPVNREPVITLMPHFSVFI